MQIDLECSDGMWRARECGGGPQVGVGKSGEEAIASLRYSLFAAELEGISCVRRGPVWVARCGRGRLCAIARDQALAVCAVETALCKLLVSEFREPQRCARHGRARGAGLG